MALLDPTLIVSTILSLSVVLLPVEVYIMFQVKPIRRKVDGVLDSGPKRSALVKEVIDLVWAPMKDAEFRKDIIHDVAAKVWEPIHDLEDRQKLISELAHGLIRAFKENEGSLRGVLARQAKSEILEMVKGGGPQAGNALGLLPGKVDLPVVGKVSPAEALSIFQTLRSMFTGQGFQNIGKVIDVGSTQSSDAGYPQ